MSRNRRQFFRIHQQLAMELSATPGRSTAHRTAGQFRVPASFTLLSELKRQQQEIQTLLQRVRNKDSTVYTFMKLVNQRIDTLAGALLEQQIDITQLSLLDVNLSEGGMLFYYPEALPVNQPVKMKLIFPDAELGLQLSASIMRCEPTLPGQFAIALAFSPLPERIRTTLARQIIEQQVLSRRQQIA